MANFIDQLSSQIVEKRDVLRERYHHGELKLDERLRAVVKKHWHAAPKRHRSTVPRPAYAIDGSNRRANPHRGTGRDRDAQGPRKARALDPRDESRQGKARRQEEVALTSVMRRGSRFALEFPRARAFRLHRVRRADGGEPAFRAAAQQLNALALGAKHAESDTDPGARHARSPRTKESS